MHVITLLNFDDESQVSLDRPHAGPFPASLSMFQAFSAPGTRLGFLVSVCVLVSTRVCVVYM